MLNQMSSILIISFRNLSVDLEIFIMLSIAYCQS